MNSPIFTTGTDLVGAGFARPSFDAQSAYLNIETCLSYEKLLCMS